MDDIKDDEFGVLRWHDGFQQWHGTINIDPHELVALEFPMEYGESEAVKQQIREAMRIILRDEFNFRELAANDLFAHKTYRTFWLDDEPFDRDVFMDEMHLRMISFDLETPEVALILDYEYGDEGMEHGIVIFFTLEAEYQHTQVS